MTTSKPLKGLFIFAWYKLGMNFLWVMGIFLLIGIAWLSNLENEMLFSMFQQGPLMVVFVLMMGLGYISNWEKYQISMPISRKQLIIAQMIPVFIATILVFAFFTAFIFIASNLHENIPFNWDTMGTIILSFNTSLLMVAFTYIFGLLPVFQDKDTVAFVIGVAVALVTANGLAHLGELAGLTPSVIAISITVLSLFCFYGAYDFSCKVYEKLDF